MISSRKLAVLVELLISSARPESQKSSRSRPPGAIIDAVGGQASARNSVQLLQFFLAYASFLIYSGNISTWLELYTHWLNRSMRSAFLPETLSPRSLSIPFSTGTVRLDKSCDDEEDEEELLNFCGDFSTLVEASSSEEYRSSAKTLKKSSSAEGEEAPEPPPVVPPRTSSRSASSEAKKSSSAAAVVPLSVPPDEEDADAGDGPSLPFLSDRPSMSDEKKSSSSSLLLPPPLAAAVTPRDGREEKSASFPDESRESLSSLSKLSKKSSDSLLPLPRRRAVRGGSAT